MTEFTYKFGDEKETVAGDEGYVLNSRHRNPLMRV